MSLVDALAVIAVFCGALVVAEVALPSSAAPWLAAKVLPTAQDRRDFDARCEVCLCPVEAGDRVCAPCDIREDARMRRIEDALEVSDDD